MPSLVQSTAGAVLLAAFFVASVVAPPPPPQCPPGHDVHDNPFCGTFEWGTIGDSWDSGVAWNDDVTYDDNKDKCLRIKDAYGAQMEADRGWTRGRQKFHFAGCSGSTLVNMVAINGQVQKTGQPQVIVMTAGGNNARFGEIVNNCIYHGNPFDHYGPPYEDDPNGVGECKKSLAAVSGYMDNKGDGGLAFDLRRTIDDIFARDEVKHHDQFWLYITSYAHFFNVDTDWCNTVSFAPWFAASRPKVVKELRQVFNDKLEQFNNIYADVVNNYKPPDKMHIGFIPISQGFNGHRFCEANHNFNDQWYSDDVYIWNLNYFTGGKEVVMQPTTDENGIMYMQKADEDSQDNYAYEDIASGGSGGGGGNEVANGWRLRPFHPKKNGHTAIKDAVIARMRADKVTGVV